MRKLFPTVYMLRMHLLLCAIVCGLILFVDQGRELARVLAEEKSRAPMAFAFIGALLLTVTLWISGRWLTLENAEDVVGFEAPPLNQAEIWAPRLCAVTPMLALAGAALRILWGAEGDDKPSSLTVKSLIGMAASLTLLAGLFLLVVWLRGRDPARAYGPESFVRKTAEGWLKGEAPVWFWSMAVLHIAFLGVVLWEPVAAPQKVGVLFMAFFFAAGAVLGLTLAVRQGATRRVPFTVGAVSLALLWSALDVNDNHALRQKAVRPFAGAAPALEGQFLKWLDEHQWTGGGGEPEPVFIVAAEGGGAYAGRHAAVFLARLRDARPDFAKRLFAISGVSGGATGAAVFAALMRDRPGEGAKLEEKAAEAYQADFLAPLMARLLFAEPLQALLPFPVEGFDRAKGLEAGFRAALERATGADWSSDAAKGVAGLWSPAGDVPALVLNLAYVESGARVYIAPFSWRSPGAVSFFDDAADDDAAEPDLAEAAILSARFPYITPPGSLTRNGRKMRFVDGGYFDNSGVESALEIAAIIQKAARNAKKSVAVHLIILNAAPPPVSEDKARSAPVQGFNELASPLRALNQARIARAVLARCAAEQIDPKRKTALAAQPDRCGYGDAKATQKAEPNAAYGRQAPPLPDGVAVHYSTLDLLKKPLPLGWLLAASTGEAIDGLIGTPPKECAPPSAQDKSNDEAMRKIVCALEGKPAP